MFAIVDIAGQQFKVEKGKSYFVHRLPNAVGENVAFDKVLLLYNENDIRVGTPLLEGISIDTKVLEHLKGDKVVVFKKKRRKGYRVKNGHRQCFTKILVETIVLDAENPKKKTAKKEVKMEQPVEQIVENPVIENTVVEEIAVETITVEKEAPKKKTATRKPATKKAVDVEQLADVEPSPVETVTETAVEETTEETV